LKAMFFQYPMGDHGSGMMVHTAGVLKKR